MKPLEPEYSHMELKLLLDRATKRLTGFLGMPPCRTKDALVHDTRKGIAWLEAKMAEKEESRE